MIRPLAPLVLLLATACTPTIIPIRDPAEPLFVRVLEGTATERAEALAALKEEHPGSPWTARARAAADLHRQRESQSQKLRQAEQERSRCRQENEDLLAEAARLNAETARLREDLDKLKKLLIDMEKRATR